MTTHFTAIANLLKTLPISTKFTIVFLFITVPYSVQAAPADMGSVTITSRNLSAGTASGTYIASGSGAKGSFTLVRNDTRGYNNNVTITPIGSTGANGIEIMNEANTGIDRDRFNYTFTIIPDDNTSIHTIKIGQASYTIGGNSEIARHTLEFTKNSQINIPARAIIKKNLSVPYFYNAMGDYFMGSRFSSTQLNSQNAVSDPQLRTDSSGGGESGLYYYNIPSLTGVSGNRNPYTPTLTNNQVSLNSNNGVLPPTPTFANIIKSTSTNPNNQTTYGPLSENTVINNGGTYVSYGIENAQSNYVVSVRNVNAVTLTYNGIMNGNIGIAGPAVGETYNEWISFGVESEPVHIFSGTVFNDNGGIDDINSNNSTIGGIYNNTRFFNGKFDPSPASAPEQGIAGSTVRLVDNCTTPTKEYGRQILTSADSGKYEFVVLSSDIDNNKKPSCIIETRIDTSYPIRTTSDKKIITFAANTYSYLNNDFGRVIGNNAALVLTKYQYINNCPEIIDYPTISNTSTDTPITGFSTQPINNIEPGKCIAYKITATNRANLSISDFVMQDVLQEKGKNNAIVTSTLANPPRIVGDFNDGLNIGDNGTLRTVSLSLDAKNKRDFYFNTKYGTNNTP